MIRKESDIKKGGLETIRGQVERITFASEDDGYVVLKVKVPGRRDLVTVVGNFVSVTPGEVLHMEGTWGWHARYGEQFRVVRYEAVTPATVEGIRKYLGSGLIKGIGPVMAKRIVNRFKGKTLDIIDEDIDRLKEVEGIGKYRLEQIKKAWEDQKEIRELMVFLRSQGVSAAYATRIFKHYGKESLKVVNENPYRLAMEVSGIGFVSADQIARNLGFPADSPFRSQAGVLYVLHQATDEGHVCVPLHWLLEESERLLEISREDAEAAVDSLVSSDRLVKEVLPEESASDFGDGHAIYLRGYHLAESQVAHRLANFKSFMTFKKRVDPEKALDWLEGKLPFKLADLQKDAVRKALQEKVVILTGGPGTGKTTLIRAILTIFKAMSARVCLAAPTGRAAKRLSEAAGHTASTLHRLLEFSPQAGGFQRNEGRPLAADLIIVDEASMMDILLTYYFLKAVPNGATLVLVGDVDQLPSVGPGNVLQDMIESNQFAVVRLTEIFRQARKSQIVMNAHRVRQGKFPRLRSGEEERQDFYFIEKEDPEDAGRIVLKLCSERIPAKFGFDPFEEIQVLTPMHKGLAGTHRLNDLLQAALNPQARSLERNGRRFRVNDKVMQIRNNYDKDVFNGDLGRIRRIDMEQSEMHVEMDGRTVIYDFSELDDLTLAYAVSVHKAQGSEYKAVVLVLLTQHYVMLQRNLLYTAITRARNLVVIVGSKKALAMAVRNNRAGRRFTLLRQRLMGALTLNLGMISTHT